MEGLNHIVLFHSLNDRHLESFYLEATLRNASTAQLSPSRCLCGHLLPALGSLVTWGLEVNYMKNYVWFLSELHNFTLPALSVSPCFSQPSMS